MNHLKRFMLVMSLVVAFLFGACSVGTVGAAQNNPLKIWLHNENGRMQTYCLIDEVTGVNYIVVATDDVNGGDAPAICPRYNADGSLYVTE